MKVNEVLESRRKRRRKNNVKKIQCVPEKTANHKFYNTQNNFPSIFDIFG